MKKLYILGLVFLLLLTSVYAQNAKDEVYETSFIQGTKFTVEGTSINDYNKGLFHINDGFQSVFSVEVNTPLPITFGAGILDSDGNTYECNPGEPGNEVSSANSPVYGVCQIFPYQLNHTGHYFVYINTTGNDEDFYILQVIEIIDAQWSGLMWATLSLFILFGLLAWYFKEGYLVVIGMMFLTGFAIDAMLIRYNYIFGFWGWGIIGIIAVLLLLLVKKLVEETLK